MTHLAKWRCSCAYYFSDYVELNLNKLYHYTRVVISGMMLRKRRARAKGPFSPFTCNAIFSPCVLSDTPAYMWEQVGGHLDQRPFGYCYNECAVTWQRRIHQNSTYKNTRGGGVVSLPLSHTHIHTHTNMASCSVVLGCVFVRVTAE